MKTNRKARWVVRLRPALGIMLILAVAVAECWFVGHCCSRFAQASARPSNYQQIWTGNGAVSDIFLAGR